MKDSARKAMFANLKHNDRITIKHKDSGHEQEARVYDAKNPPVVKGLIGYGGSHLKNKFKVYPHEYDIIKNNGSDDSLGGVSNYISTLNLKGMNRKQIVDKVSVKYPNKYRPNIESDLNWIAKHGTIDDIEKQVLFNHIIKTDKNGNRV